MKAMRSCVWLVLAMGAACSSESGINKIEAGNGVDPGIEVDPTWINFGVLEEGEESSAVVTVTNIGSVTLTIEGLVPEGAFAFTITADRMLDTLAPEEFTQFTVNYVASGAVDEGTVTVVSNDAVSPEIPVELMGGLTDPELVWLPDPLDFGVVETGTTVTESVTMQNIGATDLEVEELVLSGDAFEADLPEVPFTLTTGETLSFDVTFDADASGPHAGTITATGNATEDLVLDITGTVSSGPIAVCRVDPETVVSHSETATWYGDESYDPGGAEIVDYDWTLYSRPDGSSATMPSGEANRRPFEWDLAGEYVGKLVVTNEYGEESEPCYATLTATPEDDFWIEMYWTYSGDDMDLHLLAPGGSVETNSDCYYSNCVSGGALDWGTRGYDEDDPSLDLDDISGTGPENIRIMEPEDGEYTVIVHDYPGSTYSGGNRVYVNIYIGGELAWSRDCEISGENTYNEFATVDFPAGTVTDGSMTCR